MNKIFSIVLIAVLLIATIALVSCKKEEPLDCGHHTFVDTVVDSTCKTMGYVNHVCSTCGYEYKDNYSEEHHYVDTIVVPTCDKEGYTSRTCTDCGKTIRENITPVDNKNHVTFAYVNTVLPTCTEFGYDIEECEACGYQHKNNYVAPTHAWSHGDNSEEWPLVAEVTCGDYGIRRRTCTVEGCGAVEEVIEKNAPHIQDNSTVSTTTGLMTHYCDCGEYYYTTDEYVNVLELQLVEADGAKYYVVEKLMEGVVAEYVYVPFSIDNVLVTEILAGAFMNKTEIKEVRIAVTVTKIGAMAFSGCTGLTTIVYDGTLAQWENIQKLDGWKFGAGNFTVVCSDGEYTY